MLYWNDTTWISVTPGANGSTLSLCNNVPTWGRCVPILTTGSVSDITLTSATASGTITSDRGFPVTSRGVCWSTSSNPTADGNHTTDGNTAGTFVSSLTGLTPHTMYYVRAYAANSEGTAYGNEVSFTTSSTKQVLCFNTPDGIGGSNWSYKDYIIPDGYRIDSLFMDASRPGYPEYQYDLNLAYCPGSTTYNFPVAIFPLDYGKIATSMYTTWIDLTKLSIIAAGMVRVKLPTGEGAEWNSLCLAISLTELPGWVCGKSITVNHGAGSVAPVTKTVTYGTVTNIPGEPSKCWITQNLGADHQATAVDDTTETSAGWYWQFNRKQGYKHDGLILTPNTYWVNDIDEISDWTPANDPCILELGSGWRIPTLVEWTNVLASGNWIYDWSGPWNSALKIHTAGAIQGSSGFSYRKTHNDNSSVGYYHSSTQSKPCCNWFIYIYNTCTGIFELNKGNGSSIRCIKD